MGADGNGREHDAGKQRNKAHAAGPLCGRQVKLGVVCFFCDGDAGQEAALLYDFSCVYDMGPFRLSGRQNPLPFWSENVKWEVDGQAGACYNDFWLDASNQ